MSYVAKKTVTLASKGYERKNYSLVEGESVEGMDAKTLAHCCKKGIVEKVEADAKPEAPVKKTRKRKSKKAVEAEAAADDSNEESAE